MDNYYTTLELGKDASPEEIKANYRRLAMKWHPDRNPGSKDAEDRFKKMAEAYAVLSDNEKRRDYDSYVASGSDRGFTQGGFAGPEGSAGFAGGFADFADFASFAGFAGFAGFRPFTAEDASTMFRREMYALAGELTMQNVGWQDIAAALEGRGCPPEEAVAIAQELETRRKTLIRGNAKLKIFVSSISCMIGIAFVTTYGGLGFGILGFLGILVFLSGAWGLAKAVFHLATGRAPKR